MATKKMTADDRRAWHEQAIADGGSVFHGGQVHTTQATLPSKGELATTEKERYEALADLERRRQSLNDEEARIRSEVGPHVSSGSDELPDDFPGHAALSEAGYTTASEVNGLSEEELTAIPGIGKATAQRIIEARK